MSGNLSFFNKLFWWLNIFAALCLLLSYLSPYVNPADFWLFAFFGLAYPIILVVNLFFIFYWLIQKKWQLLLSLLLILVGWQHLNTSLSLNFSKKHSSTSSIRLMSYNVHNFDLYNWTQNVASRNKMFSLFKEQAPDIICFQEFYTEDSGEFQNIYLLQKELGYNYNAVNKSLTLRNKDHWGLAIFSKYPIVGKGLINFENSTLNDAIFADIKIGDSIIRVYNIHLQSIQFHNEDYNYLKKISEEKKVAVKSSRKIAGRLKRAFIKRGIQTKEVGEHIDSSPYPVIIAGDFNDTPTSYAYRRLAKGRQDAFAEAGTGLGQTYAGPLPFLRIDHILLDKVFEVEQFYNIKKDYSDHYPIVCDFSFQEEK